MIDRPPGCAVGRGSAVPLVVRRCCRASDRRRRRRSGVRRVPRGWSWTGLVVRSWRWWLTAGGSGPENGPDGLRSGALADADHRERRLGRDGRVDRSSRRGRRRDLRRLDRGRWLGLDARLAVRGLLLVGRRFGEEPVEAAGEVALEAAQRALGGLAFGFFAGEVFLGGGVVLGAGDRDDVQRVVELAVTAAVEPVLGALPGRAGDRGGSGLQTEA